MTSVTFADAAGTEVTLTTDAAAAKAIEMLSGQVAALHATIAGMKAQPVRDSGATLRDHLRAQQAAQYDGSTDAGARAKALSDAWKQRPTA